MVDYVGIGDEEERADVAFFGEVFDAGGVVGLGEFVERAAEYEELAELAELLFEGHLLEQGFDALVNDFVVRRNRGASLGKCDRREKGCCGEGEDGIAED